MSGFISTSGVNKLSYVDVIRGVESSVVANRDILSGTLILKNRVTIFPHWLEIREDSNLFGFLLWWSKGANCVASGDGHLIGEISLLAHSVDCNVRVVRNYRWRTLSLIASRDIKMGEVLYLNRKER